MLTSDFPTKKMLIFSLVDSKVGTKGISMEPSYFLFKFSFSIFLSCFSVSTSLSYRLACSQLSASPHACSQLSACSNGSSHSILFPHNYSFPAYNQILTTRLVLIAQALKSVFTCLFKISLWIFVLRPGHDQSDRFRNSNSQDSFARKRQRYS